jgi:hypothetical protein
MSQFHDVRYSAPGYGAHVSGVASQLPAAGALNAPAQERPARIQPPNRPFAQRTAPSGWWLLPALLVGTAIWGLIIWWLL